VVKRRVVGVCGLDVKSLELSLGGDHHLHPADAGLFNNVSIFNDIFLVEHLVGVEMLF